MDLTQISPSDDESDRGGYDWVAIQKDLDKVVVSALGVWHDAGINRPPDMYEAAEIVKQAIYENKADLTAIVKELVLAVMEMWDESEDS